MISKLLEKLRKSKKENRGYIVTYDKESNQYYIFHEDSPYNLNVTEKIFDENMSWKEASKYSHDLNTEIGLTIHYEEEKEEKKAICPMCNYTLTRDGCGDYDVYYCPICVEYIPSSFVD